MQESMEKNVEKQMIIRTFEPNLDTLKQTARQLAHMQDVSLNLYGQAGEVLIVVTARAFAQAAATELTESVAEQFELSLGETVYGRGKGSLAYFTAGELIEHEANIAAADAGTGALLEEEFSHTKRGPSVFDFGEGTYHDARYLNKVQGAEERYADEDDIPQTVAARAAAAAKYGHADFGTAMIGLGSGEFVYIAVAHRGYVYLRRFKDSDTASKSAALMMLDLVRRLMKKQPVDNARMFKANSDFEWNEPIKKKRSNPYLAPILVLAVLIVALAGACWYFFTHYSLGGGQDDALPADNSSSVSTPASPDVPAPAPAEPEPADAQPADGAGEPGADGTDQPADGTQLDGAQPDDGQPENDGTQTDNGSEHPFARG